METRYIQISSKGQIVIPAEIRDALKLTPGTKLSIRRDNQAIILRPITPEFIHSLVGITQGLGNFREQFHWEDEER